MKILITTGIFPPAIGGSATYSSLLLNELVKRGYEVKVLTYGSGKEDKVAVKKVSNNWPKGIRHIIYFFKVLAMGLRADLILAADSSFGAAFVSVLASKFINKKIIVRITGDYAWEQGQLRFGVKDGVDEFQSKKYGFCVQLLRFFQIFAVKKAAVVIAPSNYLKKIVLGWGVNENKIKVIYNAIDFKFDAIGKTEARYALGLDGRVIISAGRLVPWKGFGALIDVVCDLKNEIKDLSLIIIGDGPDREKLKIKIKELDAGEYILMKGTLSKNELVKYLSAADVFVLNTAYEGLSHQIVEAIHLGLPVITTDVGGNPEVIKGTRYGVLVKYNDKDALKDNIKNILLRKERFQKDEAFFQKFSRENMITKLIEVLKSI